MISVSSVLAHGVGSVQDLPVPQWLFFYGASVVLVVSFVALALLWSRPVLERYRGGWILPGGLQRFLLSPGLRAILGALSFLLLVLVFSAALVGDRSDVANIAPTFVFATFWLGLVPVQIVFGDVYSVLSPWKAAADGAEWLLGRLGAPAEPYRYPERLGRWPAAAGLFLFAALELAYYDPSDPRALALAIALYSGATWIGALLFGGRAWFRYGDPFSVYFGLLALIAPFAVEERDGRRRIVLRPPVIGLARFRDTAAGTIAFVAVMLGSVGFDGFGRTTFWQDRRAGMEELGGSLFNLLGLTLGVLAVAGAYLLAVRAAQTLARTQLRLADAFVASLIPIALVYAISHYFSFLVIQGQYMIPLASDPFGWDGISSGPSTTSRTSRLSRRARSGTCRWRRSWEATSSASSSAHDRALGLFPETSHSAR